MINNGLHDTIAYVHKQGLDICPTSSPKVMLDRTQRLHPSLENDIYHK